jgi:hypothetical protein
MTAGDADTNVLPDNMFASKDCGQFAPPSRTTAMIALYLIPCAHGHSPRSWPSTSRRHAEQSEDFGFGAEEDRTLLPTVQ